MRTRLGHAVALGLTTAVATVGVATVGVAGPAAASVNDPVLRATDQSSINAACTYAADISWDRATDGISGTVTVTNYNWFAGCFKRLVVTLIDDEGAAVQTGEVRIDTACATKDFTCAPAVVQPISGTVAPRRRDKPFIDRMTVAVLDRAR